MQDAVNQADLVIKVVQPHASHGLRRFVPFGRSRALVDDPACSRGRILHLRVTRAHSHLLQALLLFRMGTASSYVSGALKVGFRGFCASGEKSKHQTEVQDALAARNFARHANQSALTQRWT